MRLSKRQLAILNLVREQGPITGEDIAASFNLTRATLRPDLTVLSMIGLLEARPRVGYYYSGSKMRGFVADLMDTIPVKRVSALPVVVASGQSAYEAVVTLFLEDLGTLFVVDAEGALEGVVSRKDLLKIALGNNDLRSIPVDLVMTRFAQVVWLEEKDTVLTAVLKLQESQVSCLPVLRSGQQRIPTGRFDLEIILKLMGEFASGNLEEVIKSE